MYNTRRRYITYSVLLLTNSILHAVVRPSTQPLKPKKPTTFHHAQNRPQSYTQPGKGGIRKKKGSREQKLTIKDMNYEQLKDLKQRLATQNKNDAVIKTLEKMVPQCKDAHELKDITLELADLHFDTGNLERAETLYSEYEKLYPGSSKIEFVSYKALLCAFYATLKADRDQTKTEDALARAQKFLKREHIFTTYAADVKKIQKQCYEKLFHSEENIIRFYIKRGYEKDMTAAKNRIASAQKEYVKHVSDAKPRLLALESTLAERQKDFEQAQKKKHELAARFPNHQTTQRLPYTSKKSLAHRF